MTDFELLDFIKDGKTLKKCRVVSAVEKNHERRIVFFKWPYNGKIYDQWAVVKLYSGWQDARIIKICPTRRSAGYHYGNPKL